MLCLAVGGEVAPRTPDGDTRGASIAPSDQTSGPPRGADEQLAGERELLRRYHRTRDAAVREELAERFMPLVRRLAARYRGGREPFEDLVQVASLGLVKAIDRFDPDRGVAFSTYAAPTILGELRRHFRDRGWSVHVPRDLQERIALVERATAELPASLGRAPSVNEVAERLDLTAEEVLEAIEAAQAHHAISIDAPQVTDDAERLPIVERLGEDDPAFETVEYGATIARVLRTLSERDRTVLHLRFVEDMTQTEIAERVGVSQMHVSRILRAALRTLREEVAGEGVD
jgi:RNA polymerase sigma-B factor